VPGDAPRSAQQPGLCAAAAHNISTQIHTVSIHERLTACIVMSIRRNRGVADATVTSSCR
jgi:hypothetical protein